MLVWVEELEVPVVSGGESWSFYISVSKYVDLLTNMYTLWTDPSVDKALD